MSAQTLKPAVTRLYDQDFVAWAEVTAHLIRQGRFDQIDAEDLAEEVEFMARKDRLEVRSRLRVLLVHLLKWKCQPAKRCRSWELTIDTQRAKLQDAFEESPSLRRGVQESIQQGYLRAVRRAGLETRLDARAFPSECPFSVEQILDEDFLP